MESFSRGIRTPGRRGAAGGRARTSPSLAPESPGSRPGRSLPSRPSYRALRGSLLIKLEQPPGGLTRPSKLHSPGRASPSSGGLPRLQEGRQVCRIRPAAFDECERVPQGAPPETPRQRLCGDLFLSSSRRDFPLSTPTPSR